MNLLIEGWQEARAANIARRQAAGEIFSHSQQRFIGKGTRFASGRAYRIHDKEPTPDEIQKDIQRAQREAQLEKIAAGTLFQGTPEGKAKAKEYALRQQFWKKHKPMMIGPAEGITGVSQSNSEKSKFQQLSM